MRRLKQILVVILCFIGLLTLVKVFIFSSDKSDEEFYKPFYDHYGIYALTVPKTMSFAGEKVPLYEMDVAERLDRELLINTYWQSQTLLLQKRANRWLPIIEPILKKKGIPDDFKYVALIESSLLNVTSPSAAVGYWQFLENTGKNYGLEVNDEIDERYHIEKATEAACKYFLEAKGSLGNWTLAAASYNMGINGIRKQCDKQHVNIFYDLWLVDETFRYIFRILAVKEVLSNPEKYGYHLRKSDLYPVLQTQTVTIDTAVSDLVAFAEKFSITYKTLKILNPWLRQNYLTNKQHKKYTLFLPATATFIKDWKPSVPKNSKKDSLSVKESINDNTDLPVKNIRHVVKKGESLLSISKKYNVSVEQIMQSNSLKNEKNIRSGQTLIIVNQ
jgi:membrane-bound lytic murein transglycosylase D